MKSNSSSNGTLGDILDRLLKLASQHEYASFRSLAETAGLDPSHDFVGASLRDMDFRNEDLVGFNFSNADLSGADFRRANVTGVSFAGAILVGTIGLSDQKQASLKVVLAQPRGFCAGVVRAIDIVERALEKYGTPVYVRHEIVHNRYIVDRLKEKGARFVNELAEVPSNAVTIFSAHGVSKAVEEEAASRKLPVLDGTCPLVKKIHSQSKRYSAQEREVIVVGLPGPQVEGIMGQIEGPSHFVQNEAEVRELNIPSERPVAYVTQSTLSVDDTRGIIAALRGRYKDIVGPETRDICYATQNRQRAVRELSKLVDVIIVVGSKHSSNANRLREIGTEEGVPSYLVDDGTQVDPSWIEGASVVGLTASASTPEVLVEDVIDALARRFTIEVSTLPGRTEHVQFRLPSELSRPAS